jgi:protein-tyrosine phosphatase
LVRRELPVAIWVGPKDKVKISISSAALGQALSQKARQGGRRARVGIPTLRKKREGWATRGKIDRTMDISWLDDDKRIGVGVAIWNSRDKMAQVIGEGVTHIIDMQVECDDTELGEEYGIKVLWNPTDDDFEAKPAELFQRGVDFARKAFEKPDSKLYIHCAAGVHRAPMMALAVLCSVDVGSLKKMGLDAARELIEDRREVADFAEVYVDSVKAFLAEQEE